MSYYKRNDPVDYDDNPDLTPEQVAELATYTDTFGLTPEEARDLGRRAASLYANTRQAKELGRQLFWRRIGIAWSFMAVMALLILLGYVVTGHAAAGLILTGLAANAIIYTISTKIESKTKPKPTDTP